LPAHLPRERVVIPAPSVCPCCQGKLVKLGEDVTETLEVIPRRRKLIQTAREKVRCRPCEQVPHPPGPFHPIARGRAGAGLLAMVLYGKYGNHLPLNRQSEGFAPARASTSTSRRSPTGLVPLPRRCRRWAF
jgi:transposase